MLRLVKPVEHLQSAMNLANAPPRTQGTGTTVAQLAQIARQLSYAGYLSTDMIVWLQSVKFLRLPSDQMGRINKISQRFWLSGISLSLVSSIAALVQLRAEGRRLRLAVGAGEDQREKGRALLRERQLIITQITQDAMDFWIPFTNLGFVSLNDGVLGALGAATSYMGLQQQWIKVNGPVSAK